MKMILLLDEQYESSFDKRIDKAFRHFGEDDKDYELLEDYLRGGIEVLHEKILNTSTDPFEITSNLIMFLQEFDELFNSNIDDGKIISLCKDFAGRQ